MPIPPFPSLTDSFRFTRLDAVWRNYTVVAVEGPRLRQAGIFGDQKRIRVSNFSGSETSSPDDAHLSFVDEDQVWIVRAKGAPSVLHEVAIRMTPFTLKDIFLEGEGCFKKINQGSSVTG